MQNLGRLSRTRRRRQRLAALRLVAAVSSVSLLISLGVEAATADRFLLNNYFPEGIPGYGAEPGVTVLSRQRPQYDPLGVRLGDFVIRPEVAESIGYNSNVLGTGAPKGSFVEQTSGSLRANSDWGRNSLAAELTFNDAHSPSYPQQDETDWSATVGGTYEIGRDVLTLAASHLQLHELPTDIDTIVFNVPGSFIASPVPFTFDDVRASYQTTLGRIVLTPNVEFSELRFGTLTISSTNGVAVPPPVNGFFLNSIPANQQYQNRNLLQGGVNARYEFAPLRSAVLVLRDISTQYVSAARNAYGPNASSNAIEALVGLDYTANAVLRYRALIGYEVREFRNATYKTHAAPVAEANLIWTPTGLTTVTGRVLRSIEDTSDPTVSGYDYTSARLQLDHEYLRNVLLTGYVGYQRADYLQLNANQTLYGGGVGATWYLNRNLRLRATYDLTRRQGSAAIGQNYLQNLALLQLRYGL